MSVDNASQIDACLLYTAQRLESRNREIDEMFLSLYTDKAKGILTEQRFMTVSYTHLDVYKRQVLWWA